MGGPTRAIQRGWEPATFFKVIFPGFFTLNFFLCFGSNLGVKKQFMKKKSWARSFKFTRKLRPQKMLFLNSAKVFYFFYFFHLETWSVYLHMRITNSHTKIVHTNLCKINNVQDNLGWNLHACVSMCVRDYICNGRIL